MQSHAPAPCTLTHSLEVNAVEAQQLHLYNFLLAGLLGLGDTWKMFTKNLDQMLQTFVFSLAALPKYLQNILSQQRFSVIHSCTDVVHLIFVPKQFLNL